MQRKFHSFHKNFITDILYCTLDFIHATMGTYTKKTEKQLYLQTKFQTLTSSTLFVDHLIHPDKYPIFFGAITIEKLSANIEQ